MDKLQFARALRQQANRISKNKSHGQEDEIIKAVKAAIKQRKRKQRREFWRMFWAYYNSSKAFRLFL